MMSGVRPKPHKAAYHHGDLRNALLDAALRIIATSGVQSLSLREAAQRVGVSHAAAYRHFARKESLLAELAENGFRELRAAILRAANAHPGDAIAQLQASGVAYVRFGIANPARLQLMFGAFIAGWDAYPGLVAASRAAFDALTDIIRAGQEHGVIRPGDATEIAIAAWAQTHGLALLLASKRIPGAMADAAAAARLAKRCRTLQIEGLLAGHRTEMPNDAQ
jgi:AcrR family transcriptional regulator